MTTTIFGFPAQILNVSLFDSFKNEIPFIEIICNDINVKVTRCNDERYWIVDLSSRTAIDIVAPPFKIDEFVFHLKKIPNFKVECVRSFWVGQVMFRTYRIHPITE